MDSSPEQVHQLVNCIINEDILYELARSIRLLPFEARKAVQSRFLQPHIVIGVDVVETDDLVTGLEETQGELIPDEAGDAGDQDWGLGHARTDGRSGPPAAAVAWARNATSRRERSRFEPRRTSREEPAGSDLPPETRAL